MGNRDHETLVVSPADPATLEGGSPADLPGCITPEQERVRSILAITILGLLPIAVLLLLFGFLFLGIPADDTINVASAILPVLIGLVGPSPGFYVGSKKSLLTHQYFSPLLAGLLDDDRSTFANFPHQEPLSPDGAPEYLPERYTAPFAGDPLQGLARVWRQPQGHQILREFRRRLHRPHPLSVS